MSGLIKLALSWVLHNATLKLYLSSTPVGSHLGGHDLTQYPDSFIVLDIRAGSKVLLLGYFQLS